jgi:hypothetical protein
LQEKCINHLCLFWQLAILTHNFVYNKFTWTLYMLSCLLICISSGHWHRVIIPEVVSIQLSSWRRTQSFSKHVEDSNEQIIEEIVRQVGHLPELYEDARSEKYKISCVCVWCSTRITESCDSRPFMVASEQRQSVVTNMSRILWLFCSLRSKFMVISSGFHGYKIMIPWVLPNKIIKSEK